jgi:hypothetical protein
VKFEENGLKKIILLAAGLLTLNAYGANSDPAYYGLKGHYGLLAGGTGAPFVVFSTKPDSVTEDIKHISIFNSKDGGKNQSFLLELNCKTRDFQVFDSALIANFETKREYKTLESDGTEIDMPMRFYRQACGG